MVGAKILKVDSSNQFTEKTYKQLLENNFSKFHNHKLDKRLQKMMSFLEGNCFLTPSPILLLYYQE